VENNHLYPYQEQYVIKILDPRFEIGRMILPTGSGKGVICREVFYRLITSLENKNNQFLGIVYTPRLMLNYQWIIDFIKYFKGQDYPLNFIFVGSEPLKNDIINKIEMELFKTRAGMFDKPISTLGYQEVEKAVNRNQSNGINSVIVSTFHSNKVIRDAGLNFDCAVFDESHFLPGRENPSGVQVKKKDLFSSVKIISRRKIFTTATEKIGDVDEGEEYRGRGMNNEDIYGKEILFGRDGVCRRISSRDLIEFGSLLEPRVHVISTDKNLGKYDIIEDIKNVSKITPQNPIQEKEFDEKVMVIKESFIEHEKELLKASSFPEKIGAKIMVVSSGSAEMEGLRDSKGMRDFKAEHPDIHFYYISSYTGVDIHGKDNQRVSNQSKGQMLDSINSLSSEDKAIIFHIDIMTCGLDIPALTGVMFFKNCNTIKLLQNIGRACRLHDKDRIRWGKGEIQPGGDGYIKPNFWVILPAVFEDNNDFTNEFGKMINSIRENYDFKSFEFVRWGKGQPKPKSKEDENGPESPIKNLKSEIERNYIQIVEGRKIDKEEKNRIAFEIKLEAMYKRGNKEEIEIFEANIFKT